jgi:hypothetical protein
VSTGQRRHFRVQDLVDLPDPRLSVDSLSQISLALVGRITVFLKEPNLSMALIADLMLIRVEAKQAAEQHEVELLFFALRWLEDVADFFGIDLV